tara:strand:+ start:131 stop:652 length:522 start_codon:yes stop_codon:yes gene_type:complete
MRLINTTALATVLALTCSCATEGHAEEVIGQIEFDRSEQGDDFLRVRWQNTTGRPACFNETYVRGGAVSEWARLINVHTEEVASYIGPISRQANWPPGNAYLIPPSGRLVVAANLSQNFDLGPGQYNADVELVGFYCDQVRYPQSQEDLAAVQTELIVIKVRPRDGSVLSIGE